MEGPVEFPSKVDPWLVVALGAGLVFPLVMGVQLLFLSKTAAFVCFGSSLFVLVLLGVAVVPCRYRLEADHLLIRAGMLRWKVPYKDIKALERTRNPLSSPALSLDRLRIDHARGWVMVSPARQADFIDGLSRRMKDAGHRLV